MLSKILLEMELLFDNEKIDGPDPEIPTAIAPLSLDIFLILSNSGINIDLSGYIISSTTDFDIKSKSSVYKLLMNDPRFADC